MSTVVGTYPSFTWLGPVLIAGFVTYLAVATALLRVLGGKASEVPLWLSFVIVLGAAVLAIAANIIWDTVFRHPYDMRKLRVHVGWGVFGLSWLAGVWVTTPPPKWKAIAVKLGCAMGGLVASVIVVYSLILMSNMR